MGTEKIVGTSTIDDELLSTMNDDGSFVCSTCHGTLYDENMSWTEDYIEKEKLVEYGMCACSNCGRTGKIDFVDMCMGKTKEFWNTTEGQNFIKEQSNFIAFYKLFGGCNENDDPDVARKETTEFINREIDPFNNHDHMYRLNIETEESLKDLLVKSPESFIGDELNVSSNMWNYIKRSIEFTASNILLNEINRNIENGVLPTSGLEKCLSFASFIGYDDSKSNFINIVNTCIEDLESYCIDYEFEYSFEKIIKIVSYTVESKRYISTRKELEKKGMLLFS